MKGSTPLAQPMPTGFALLSLPKELSEPLSRDGVFLKKLHHCILRNLGRQSFGVESLADMMFISVSQLNRKLNALLSRPAGQLIRELRLYFAARLLACDAGAIGEIAHQAGFSDQAHFCRSFKKLFRCTPSQYRDGHQLTVEAELFWKPYARNRQKDAQNGQARPF